MTVNQIRGFYNVPFASVRIQSYRYKYNAATLNQGIINQLGVKAIIISYGVTFLFTKWRHIDLIFFPQKPLFGHYRWS